MKYELGDIVFFLRGYKIKWGKVIARTMQEYIPNINFYVSLIVIDNLKMRFGDSIKQYAVQLEDGSYNIFLERELFSSKEKLIEFIS
jgi:hypothetical protein